MLGHYQLGGFTVVTANLVYAKSYGFILGGVLAFDHQYWDAVDEKDHILPCAVVAVVKRSLLGDLKNVPPRIVVIDQDQVSLAVLLLVEELAPVAQVIHEFAVAMNVCAEMPEPAE